jgi:cytoskeletal protein RodZ
MTRTNQGGSGLSFIVIGIILVGLLAGGIYLVRQQLNQPEQTWPPEESSEVVSEDQEEIPVDESAPSQEKAPETSTETTVELPQTGIAEITTVFSLGLLSLTVVAYARSRRPELSL